MIEIFEVFQNNIRITDFFGKTISQDTKVVLYKYVLIIINNRMFFQEYRFKVFLLISIIFISFFH